MAEAEQIETMPLTTAGTKLDVMLLALQERLDKHWRDFLDDHVPYLSWATNWKDYARPIKIVVDVLQEIQTILENMAGDY